jgi:hypothetical protein
VGSISNLSNNYVQSVFNTVLQTAGVTTSTSGNGVSAIGTPSDNSQLSPFAQLVSTLQQLQQSDPAKYQQVTQQIATNLQAAAQTAQTNGNSTAATQLNQLAADFTNASKTGQLPNFQDLAKGIGGHHHHHHGHAAPSDSDNTSNTQTDPFSIIQNTLNSAGTSSPKS